MKANLSRFLLICQAFSSHRAHFSSSLTFLLSDKVSIVRLNRFGDILTHLLNRLPLPRLSLLDYLPQTREGEMKGKHQAFLGRSTAKKLAPGGDDLLGVKVNGSMPFGALQVNWMERYIGDAQQLFAL